MISRSARIGSLTEGSQSRIKRARQLVDSGGATVFIRIRIFGIELRDDIRQLDGRLTGKTVGLLLERVHVVQRPRSVPIDWVGQDQSKSNDGIAILVSGQFTRDVNDTNRAKRLVRLELRADLGDFASRSRSRIHQEIILTASSALGSSSTDRVRPCRKPRCRTSNSSEMADLLDAGCRVADTSNAATLDAAFEHV